MLSTLTKTWLVAVSTPQAVPTAPACLFSAAVTPASRAELRDTSFAVAPEARTCAAVAESSTFTTSEPSAARYEPAERAPSRLSSVAPSAARSASAATRAAAEVAGMPMAPASATSTELTGAAAGAAGAACAAGAASAPATTSPRAAASAVRRGSDPLIMKPPWWGDTPCRRVEGRLVNRLRLRRVPRSSALNGAQALRLSSRRQ